jgi:hypothetical protein
MKRIRFLGWLGLGVLFVACGRSPVSEPAVTPTPVVVAQWAVAAQASSEFGFPDWSASRATGEPDVNTCTSDPRAWASARGSGLESLELTYAEPVYATEVRIYQTWGRGALSRVLLVDEGGAAQLVWEGTDTADPCPGALIIPVPRTPYQVVGVRLELDESRTGFWNEIDAVELVGVQ